MWLFLAELYQPTCLGIILSLLYCLTQGLVDKLAEHQHAVWAKKKRAQLDAVGGGIHPLLVPYDMLTVAEKEHYRKHVTELFRFLQTNGFRIAKYVTPNHLI